MKTTKTSKQTRLSVSFTSFNLGLQSAKIVLLHCHKILFLLTSNKNFYEKQLLKPGTCHCIIFFRFIIFKSTLAHNFAMQTTSS